jgi:hypothetical protein
MHAWLLARDNRSKRPLSLESIEFCCYGNSKVIFIRLTWKAYCLALYREVTMFESVDEKKGGMPWGVIAGLIAFAGLVAVGYFAVT